MTTEKTLSPQLIELLQGEKIVFLITTDQESKQPHLSVISWVVAHPEGNIIKFAVGHKAASAKNIQSEPRITLGVIGAGSCYAIKGSAIVSDIIEKTMKLRIVTVTIDSVEDVIFYGGKITVEPEYVKTYNAALAATLDNEIYSLLRE
jgi:hypothetical protein